MSSSSKRSTARAGRVTIRAAPRLRERPRRRSRQVPPPPERRRIVAHNARRASTKKNSASARPALELSTPEAEEPAPVESTPAAPPNPQAEIAAAERIVAEQFPPEPPH